MTTMAPTGNIGASLATNTLHKDTRIVTVVNTMWRLNGRQAM